MSATGTDSAAVYLTVGDPARGWAAAFRAAAEALAETTGGTADQIAWAGFYAQACRDQITALSPGERCAHPLDRGPYVRAVMEADPEAQRVWDALEPGERCAAEGWVMDRWVEIAEHADRLWNLEHHWVCGGECAGCRPRTPVD